MTLPSSSKLLRQRAEQYANEVITSDGISRLPIDPLLVAKKRDITVSANRVKNAGISGCLMKLGDHFGIGYATHIDNQGFINFTIAHELGHYFLPGHVDHFFGTGGQIHLSHAGFVSNDNYEKEADFFAAALLMPKDLFAAALRTAGGGFAAISVLANKCRASFTATAIRYSQLADIPVAVILTSNDLVECCFVSDVLREVRGIFPLQRGDSIPSRTPTARFNQDALNRGTCNCDTATSLLSDWFEKAPAVEVSEDVVGLGKYGKTLTVLFAEEVSIEDGDSDEEEQADTGLPSSKWRARDYSRDE